MHIKKGEGGKNDKRAIAHAILSKNFQYNASLGTAQGSVTAFEQQYVREEEGSLDAWKTGCTQQRGTSQNLSQEIFLTLSTGLHSHGPLSHAPGSQSFPQVRNQPQEKKVKLNQRCKEKDRSYRTPSLKTHIYCCSEDGSRRKGRKSLAELRERLKETLFTF